MGDDHSGWIAVLEIPGIPQIWVEEWIGKSATITKIPDLDGCSREPRGECLRPIRGSFLHPIGSIHRDTVAKFPIKILTLNLPERSKSHGEWIGKLAKTTRMTKIKNSPERSKTGFPGPLVVIYGDLRRVVTIPDG